MIVCNLIFTAPLKYEPIWIVFFFFVLTTFSIAHSPSVRTNFALRALCVSQRFALCAKYNLNAYRTIFHKSALVGGRCTRAVIIRLLPGRRCRRTFNPLNYCHKHKYQHEHIITQRRPVSLWAVAAAAARLHLVDRSHGFITPWRWI